MGAVCGTAPVGLERVARCHDHPTTHRRP